MRRQIPGSWRKNQGFESVCLLMCVCVCVVCNEDYRNIGEGKTPVVFPHLRSRSQEYLDVLIVRDLEGWRWRWRSKWYSLTYEEWLSVLPCHPFVPGTSVWWSQVQFRVWRFNDRYCGSRSIHRGGMKSNGELTNPIISMVVYRHNTLILLKHLYFVNLDLDRLSSVWLLFVTHNDHNNIINIIIR